jgi:hypothetical protein
MPAFLPPSSKDTSRMPSAAAFMIAVPVRVSPVKVMASTPGWRVRNSPAESGSEAVHDVVDALGDAHAFITSPSRAPCQGVSSDGFTTTVLPQARAGPTFQVISRKGAFHGLITPTTPLGRRMA